MTARETDETNDHIVRAYIAYSRFMAVLAFLLPVALLLSGFIVDDRSLKDSLSDYYHGVDLQRNLFVGTLCAVAAFLALYKGLRGVEANLLNVAGVSAVFVAFIPTPEEENGFFSGHGVAAFTLFGCIIVVGVVLPWIKKKLGRAAATPPLVGYAVSAAIMVVGALLAVLGKLRFPDSRAFLLGEVFLVAGFGIFWWIRTRHLSQPSVRRLLLD